MKRLLHLLLLLATAQAFPNVRYRRNDTLATTTAFPSATYNSTTTAPPSSTLNVTSTSYPDSTSTVSLADLPGDPSPESPEEKAAEIADSEVSETELTAPEDPSPTTTIGVATETSATEALPTATDEPASPEEMTSSAPEVDPTSVATTTYEVYYTSVAVSADGGSSSYIVSASSSLSTIPSSSVTTVASATGTVAPARRPKQGTEANAPGVGEGEQVLGLVAPNYNAARTVFTSNPALPTGDCKFQYRHVLGGRSTKDLGDTFIYPGKRFREKDVKQGNVGDCGLGAAVIAMITSGNEKYLTAMTRFSTNKPTAGDQNLVIWFREGATQRKVYIDDQLPYIRPDSTSDDCWPWLGYQPVQDDDFPAANPTNVYFMPLLEKAWAKYLDAFPQYRYPDVAKDPKAKGYAGIWSTPASNALAAFTGGKAVSTPRGTKLLAALKRCLTQSSPCVICIPEIADLGTVGKLSNGGADVYLGPVGDRSGRIHRTTTGEKDGKTVYADRFRITDNDNPDAKGQARIVRLPGHHAYAIDRKKSLWKENLRQGRITLINPWGCIPVAGEDVEGCSGSASVTISLSIISKLAHVVHEVSGIRDPLVFA